MFQLSAIDVVSGCHQCHVMKQTSSPVPLQSDNGNWLIALDQMCLYLFIKWAALRTKILTGLQNHYLGRPVVKLGEEQKKVFISSGILLSQKL